MISDFSKYLSSYANKYLGDRSLGPFFTTANISPTTMSLYIALYTDDTLVNIRYFGLSLNIGLKSSIKFPSGRRRRRRGVL